MAQLTEEQRAVVVSQEPRLTVRAGAGSGKTRVLVDRYLRFVIEDGIEPEQILTVTFTRKAAAEMKERIIRALKSAGRYAQAQSAETGPIQTFDSLCEKLLRENSVSAGIDPGFEVMKDSVRKPLIESSLSAVLLPQQASRPQIEKYIAKQAGKRGYNIGPSVHAAILKEVTSLLDKLRTGLISREELENIYRSPESFSSYSIQMLRSMEFGQVAAEYERSLEDDTPDAKLERNSVELTVGLMQIVLAVWKQIETEMERLQQFDFPELERRCSDMLRHNESARKRVNAKFKAILVDEAQDLNPVQYRLLNALKLDSQMFVGDPQQSIYGFRQADYRLFEEYSRHSYTLSLSSNFRTSEGVLGFIDRLFAEHWGQEYVPMMSQVRQPGEIQIWESRRFSSAVVADGILNLIQSGVNAGKITVVVRKDIQGQMIVKELRKLGVNAQLAGGGKKLFQRQHVLDLANALEALTNPDADYALLCVLRSPIVGISLDSLVMLADRRQREDSYLRSVIETAELEDEDDQDKLDRFREWFEPLSLYADRLSAWEALSEILRESPYLAQVAKLPEPYQPIANIRKVFGLAVDDRKMGPMEFAKMVRRLRDVTDEGDAPANDMDEDTVNVMTIHKAKGLEFDTVVVPCTYEAVNSRASEILADQDTGIVAMNLEGQKQKLYTWLRSRYVEKEKSEQLRLMYVAMTRAINRLCLLGSESPQIGKEQSANCIAKSVYELAKSPEWPSGLIQILDFNPAQENA